MKKKRIQGKKQNKGAWRAFIEYVKKHFAVIIGVILTAVVSAVITKACDRIIPDPPTIVEKVPDTIQVVHMYDSLFSGAAMVYLQQSEEAIDADLRTYTKDRKSQKVDNKETANKVFISASFPNAKGYTTKSSAAYCSIEMSPLDKAYVDFTIDFFSEEIFSEIYCLSIKVFKVQNGGRVYILDENFEKRTGQNVIRLKDIFASEKYEIEVGFFLTKDRNAQYPDFYSEAKYINKIPHKE